MLHAYNSDPRPNIPGRSCGAWTYGLLARTEGHTRRSFDSKPRIGAHPDFAARETDTSKTPFPTMISLSQAKLEILRFCVQFLSPSKTEGTTTNTANTVALLPHKQLAHISARNMFRYDVAAHSRYVQCAKTGCLGHVIYEERASILPHLSSSFLSKPTALQKLPLQRRSWSRLHTAS